MKTRFIPLVAAYSLSIFVPSTMAQFIADTYWGGGSIYTSNGSEAVAYQNDVIGADEVFNLTGAEVIHNVQADSLEVIIYGNYFDDLLLGQNLETTQLGDLFISTNGLVDNDTGADTLSDYFKSTETKEVDYTTWDYGVQLGTYLNEDTALSGQKKKGGNVHEITDADSQIGLSWLAKDWSVYRGQQEVDLNFAYNAEQQDASWYFDDRGQVGFLSITINDFTSLFGTFENLGFHWAMTCGNDVLEFEWTNTNPVPEPQTIALFGVLGMGGYLLIRRRLIK